MNNITDSLTLPDFWDVLVCQTLREENLDFEGAGLSEYSWWCEQMEDLEEAYRSGLVSPVDARVEIFNITITQYALALEDAYKSPSK